MWKYLEPPTGGKKTHHTEAEAREAFGVNEKRCPVVALTNGWTAVWCAEPLGKPGDYPELSHAPKAKDSGFSAVQ